MNSNVSMELEQKKMSVMDNIIYGVGAIIVAGFIVFNMFIAAAGFICGWVAILTGKHWVLQ